MNTNGNLFKKFLIVWSGQLISNIGSGLTAFTLGVFAYQSTHSATNYALIILFSFLPSLLLKPVGGVLADRFDRRLMMIIGDLGSTSGLVFILGFLMTGHLEMWQIYLGATLTSVFGALQNPAYKASVSDLVPQDKYSQASGLMQLAATSQFLVSPVLAGILFSIMDVKYILMLDILSFLIAVLAVFWVKGGIHRTEKPQEKPHFIQDMKEGLKTITVNRGIVVLISITSVLCFYIGFLQTLIGPMMLNYMSPKGYGIAMALCASGLLFSSLLIGAFGGIKKHVKNIIVFLALIGLFYALMGVSKNIFVTVAAGFLFFFSLAFVQTSLEVLIRQNIDNEKQGRVWSLISVVTQLGYPLAYAIAGFLADDVFNPMLKSNGILASSVGKIIGTGQGRGIGLMFIVAGLLVMVLSWITSRMKIVRTLEG